MPFVKGKSGNPSGGARKGSGRKKSPVKEQRQKLKVSFEDCVEDARRVLIELMNDPIQPGSVRVSAAKELLDRGLGKSVQQVEHSGSVSLEELICSSAEGTDGEN